MIKTLKRKPSAKASLPIPKKQKVEIPEYHTAKPRRDDTGEIVWPARALQIDRARDIIREW